MLGGLWPVAHIDPRLWDKVVATNLTCVYRLIRSTEPLLRRADAGRALFLTSGRAVLVDPNQMRTRMRAEAFPGEDPDTLPHPSEIGPMIVALAAAADLGLPTSTVLFSEWRAAAMSPLT